MISCKNDLKTRCWQKKPTPLPKQKQQQQSLYLDPLPKHIELALNILEGWQQQQQQQQQQQEQQKQQQ